MQPLPGDFAVVRMGGLAGRAIEAAEELDRLVTSDDDDPKAQHAFIFVGRGQIVEAEPGGARVSNLSRYDGRALVWSSLKIHPDAFQRRAIVERALALAAAKTPYSWLDYFAIFLKRLHIPGARLFKRFVASSKHLMCSQLVDKCYKDAGLQLFTDGRWPGYVTPGDLLALIRPDGDSN